MSNRLKSASNSKTHLERSLALKYKADQQIKYLHLDAEVESLLLEVQTIQRRMSDKNCLMTPKA